MRDYNYSQYIELIERIDDEILQKHMKKEIEVIRNVEDSKNKTFIDLGAGYGRVLPLISKIARNVISIDINPDMIIELKKRSEKYDNAKVITEDFSNLEVIVENEDIKNPVLISLQNTIGTVEGNYMDLLSNMKNVAEKYNGEIIISFFRQESLKTWGMDLYPKLKEMLGEPDLDKIDFEKGIMVTKNGYISKWRNVIEIEKIKKYFGGKVINEVITPEFYIFHIKF